MLASTFNSELVLSDVEGENLGGGENSGEGENSREGENSWEETTPDEDDATGEGVVKYLFNVVVPFCFGTSTQLVMWRVQFEIIAFPFFRARVGFFPHNLHSILTIVLLPCIFTPKQKCSYSFKALILWF